MKKQSDFEDHISEAAMRDLMAAHPSEFFPEELTLIGTEVVLAGRRADIVFEDRHKRRLIVELQRGTLSREKTGQIAEYYGLMKVNRPEQFVELVLVANNIPTERRLFLESIGVSCLEIPEHRFIEIEERLGMGLHKKHPTISTAPASIPRVDASNATDPVKAIYLTGAYPPDTLENAKRVFKLASHKLRDLAEGNNKNGTDHVPLTDFVFECALEVKHLVGSNVLSASEILGFNHIRRLAELDAIALQALREQEITLLQLNIPRGTGERFAQVRHRILGNEGKLDKRYVKLMDRPLEHFVSVAFGTLWKSVPLLRIE